MKRISRRDALVGAGVLGAAGVAGGAGEPPRPDRDGRPRVDHYTTAPNAELVAALPLAHDPYRYTTLYSLKLPGLRTGDVVQAHTQFEVTNDLGFNVQIAHGMFFHRKETIVTHGASPVGQGICEYAGENVSAAMHHGFRTLIGSLAAPADGDGWVSVVVYAASLFTPAGAKVGVQKGYGGLRAIVFRNAGEARPVPERGGK